MCSPYIRVQLVYTSRLSPRRPNCAGIEKFVMYELARVVRELDIDRGLMETLCAPWPVSDWYLHVRYVCGGERAKIYVRMDSSN